MSDFPWLLVLGLIPLVGAVVVALLPTESEVLAKKVALGFSLAALWTAVEAWLVFKKAKAGYQFRTSYSWIPQFGVHFSLGANGISMPLILLASVLTPVVVLASWHECEGAGVR